MIVFNNFIKNNINNKYMSIVNRLSNFLTYFTRKNKNKKKNMTRKNKFNFNKSKIFTLDGKFEYSDEKYQGKSFFRKMTNDILEKKIAEIIKKNPHDNIVTIYRIGTNYIDMELLNDDVYSIYSPSEINKIMLPVKNFLQEIGIVYIDWKPDNIGISKSKKKVKLFDFDASGIINIKTKKWEDKAPTLFAYRQAVKNGMKTPIEIDNYAFDKEFN